MSSLGPTHPLSFAVFCYVCAFVRNIPQKTRSLACRISANAIGGLQVQTIDNNFITLLSVYRFLKDVK